MPKGKGGKKHKRGKNKSQFEESRELVFKEDGQEYAQITQKLGNGRLTANCFDGIKRLAHIRGTMRRRIWIEMGDIVLVSLREFQDAKCDIILKYSDTESRNLKVYGELPDKTKIGNYAAAEDTGKAAETDCAFDFSAI